MTNPATDKQFDLLQVLTAKDWRATNIDRDAAAKLLDQLTRAKASLGEVAVRNAGQRAWEANMQASGQPQPQPQPQPAPSTDTLTDAVFRAVFERREELLDGLDVGTQRKVLHVVRPDLTHVEVKGQHQTFEDLLLVVSQRDHVMLVGPAGTGKTSGAKSVAEALSLRWSYWASNPRVTASALMGFVDANGQYVRTQFRDAYEHGGVFILDEVDNAAPDLLTALNGAIENGTASFPDGLVERHPDFVVVATANTYGKGADRVYSGRQQLDGATLDRFIVLDWGYDVELERQLAPLDVWTDYVQAVREVVERMTIREVVSMRASIKGGRYLQLGWPWAKVEQSILFRGWSKDNLSKVESVRQQFADMARQTEEHYAKEA